MVTHTRNVRNDRTNKQKEYTMEIKDILETYVSAVTEAAEAEAIARSFADF